MKPKHYDKIVNCEPGVWKDEKKMTELLKEDNSAELEDALQVFPNKKFFSKLR